MGIDPAAVPTTTPSHPLSIRPFVHVLSDILPREVMHVPEESLESGTRAETKRGRGRPRKTNLTSEIVGELLAKGFTQTQIAIEHNVSKQTVSVLAKAVPNRARSPREAIRDNFPWPDMAPGFKKAAIYEHVSEYLKWMELGTEKLTERQRKRLRAWLDTLQELNQVVVFDPTILPTVHSRYGGWQYAPRTESDGDLLIRVNEHVVFKNPEEAEEIWRMPEDRP
ncbi:helix-turn-helix domain-containing protein [Kibdelosporangium lantanae]|uniref:Helix-turn-helix domain-containing protein n=1 Tax=Kibdelosporangium lantanae TaxID=1497396 RepID=A0ABW3M254_9PSEU